jgi:hypothetical protein
MFVLYQLKQTFSTKCFGILSFFHSNSISSAFFVLSFSHVSVTSFRSISDSFLKKSFKSRSNNINGYRGIFKYISFGFSKIFFTYFGYDDVKTFILYHIFFFRFLLEIGEKLI